MIMNGDRPDGPRFHVDVPDLQRQVISREDVASIMTELDI